MQDLSPDDLIDCINQAGQPMQLKRAEFAFRPAAYAFITRGEELLAFRVPNGKYFLPGGGVEPGEPVLEALHREVFEEVGGAEIDVIEQLGFFEHFYYYDDTQSAWHGLSHVYLCALRDSAWEIPAGAGSAVEGRPEWVRLDALTEEQVHSGIMPRVLASYADRKK